MNPIAKTFVARRRRYSLALPLCAVAALSATALSTKSAQARPSLPPAAVGAVPAMLPEGAPNTRAAFLVDQALKVANAYPGARIVAVRSAAAILPRLLPADAGANVLNRDSLTKRWISLAMSKGMPRAARLDAFDSFADIAVKTDLPWASAWSMKLPDPAARAGAYLTVSRGYEALRQPDSWTKADDFAALAQRAARLETDPTTRARALVFVAYRMTELSPARQEEALMEASMQVHKIPAPDVRDNLLAELTGAAARFDLNMGRRMAGDISNEGLKNLASARVNLTEVSQTTLTTRSKERVTALAAAAAPYDSRALPVLLQLPSQPEVLKAISDTLPRIYPTAHPAIETSELERIWNYSQSAPAGAYRDQLQSRVARLMVLKDLWRGRTWGKQLFWKGGRVQVGAFLNQVLASRRASLKVGRLQDTAQTDPAIAYSQSLPLAAPARVEALLLLAGEILG